MIDAINEEIDKLEKAGFVELSISPFAAPTVCIKKKDGSLRLVNNYRSLNLVKIKNCYLLPLIEDLLDQLGGAKIFSKIDLNVKYS